MYDSYSIMRNQRCNKKRYGQSFGRDKLQDNVERVIELLEMLEKDSETAKRGMRIW